MCSQLANQYGENNTGKTLNNKRTDVHRTHAIMFITEGVLPPSLRPCIQDAQIFHFCNRRCKISLIHLKYVAVTCYVSLKACEIHFVYVNWFIKFCNISIYPSFVMHLPEDSHKSGRNM